MHHREHYEAWVTPQPQGYKVDKIVFRPKNCKVQLQKEELIKVKPVQGSKNVNDRNTSTNYLLHKQAVLG